MELSIIIINYKTFDLTYNCVQSILECLKNYSNEYEILIVDNDSQDGSFEKLKMLEDVNIHIYQSGKNGGFAFGNNIGAAYAKGEYLLFLNSDTIVYNDIFFKMIQFLKENKEYGSLSCLMEDGNHQPLVVGHPFENIKTLFIQTFIKPCLPNFIKKMRGKMNHELMSHSVQKQDWICGACFLMNRCLFNEINGWDEKFFMYMEDEYLCYKIHQKGYAVGVYPVLGIQHFVGQSAISYFSLYHRFKSARLYFHDIYGMDKKIILFMLYIQVFFGMKGKQFDQRYKVIKMLKKEIGLDL